MQDELISGSLPDLITPRPTPYAVLATACLAALLSAFLCAAAIIDRAPAGAVPVIVLVCVGAPLFGSFGLPEALASVLHDRRGGRALTRLRRGLAELPETPHPLGL